MGQIAKGTPCSVQGCTGEAIRSLAAKRVGFTDIEAGRGGRVYLCRTHYKAHKKQTGDARRVERWRWNS